MTKQSDHISVFKKKISEALPHVQCVASFRLESCGVDDLLFRSVNFVDAIVRTFAKKI